MVVCCAVCHQLEVARRRWLSEREFDGHLFGLHDAAAVVVQKAARQIVGGASGGASQILEYAHGRDVHVLGNDGRVRHVRVVLLEGQVRRGAHGESVCRP